MKKQNCIQIKLQKKPSIEYSGKYLLIDNKFFGNFGAFILTKELFDELQKIVERPIEEGKEYQLMDAFDNLMKKNDVHGFVVNGMSYDMGNIEAYTEVLRKY